LGEKEDNPNCKLCGKFGSLEHILSTCNVALTEGRYRWRHDKILNEIGLLLNSEKERLKGVKAKGPTFINFVTKGAAATREARQPTGVLPTSNDWDLKVDLGKQLRFPPEIVETSLRPDIILVSKNSKQVIMIELTVPWEDRILEANERKREKYQELVNQCTEAGWKARCEPVEVGARGFIGQSMWRCLRMLGIVGTTRKQALTSVTAMAERTSRWLWLKREQAWSKPS